MYFAIIHNGKHVKYYRCGGVAEANKECRAVERDYKLSKYSVKAVKGMKETRYCQRGAGYIEANRFEKDEVVCRNCKTYPSGTVARCDKPKGEKK